MEEELELIMENTKDEMNKAINHLDKIFLTIRAGRANASMLNAVMIDYYGAPTPLSQVANITTPDAMTLSIQPWEKGIVQAIEKGILIANLGFNPSNNGDYIMINIPALTEERRKDLAKQAKMETENAKIGIRSARKEGNQDLKKVEAVSEDRIKVLEEEIQKMTDAYNKKAEELLVKKEKEIMTI